MTNVGCQRRAIIAGGSVGGLSLGNVFVKSGLQVDSFERASDALLERGAGIAGHAERDPSYHFAIGILRASARLPPASTAAANHTPNTVH